MSMSAKATDPTATGKHHRHDDAVKPVNMQAARAHADLGLLEGSGSFLATWRQLPVLTPVHPASPGNVL